MIEKSRGTARTDFETAAEEALEVGGLGVENRFVHGEVAAFDAADGEVAEEAGLEESVEVSRVCCEIAWCGLLFCAFLQSIARVLNHDVGGEVDSKFGARDGAVGEVRGQMRVPHGPSVGRGGRRVGVGGRG